jgi:hypothetical protein
MAYMVPRSVYLLALADKPLVLLKVGRASAVNYRCYITKCHPSYMLLLGSFMREAEQESVNRISEKTYSISECMTYYMLMMHSELLNKVCIREKVCALAALWVA